MNDAFDYRLDLLKKELDFIDSSIRKIDDIANGTKNWAILTWTGSIAVILGRPELYTYVFITAFPPLLFLLVDAHWRNNQRRFIFRQECIRDYLNSPKFDEDYSKRCLSFEIFDPFSRKTTEREALLAFISVRRIIKFPTVYMIYCGLALLSFVLAIVLYFNPPEKPNQSPEPTPTAVTPAAKQPARQP